MPSISRTDRLLDQLRARIGTPANSGARADGPARPASMQQGIGENRGRSPVSMVRRLHESGVTDERVLVGRLVEGMLLGELGDGVQGASFQFGVSQVVDTLERDPESWALCRACVAEALN